MRSASTALAQDEHRRSTRCSQMASSVLSVIRRLCKLSHGIYTSEADGVNSIHAAMHTERLAAQLLETDRRAHAQHAGRVPGMARGESGRSRGGWIPPPSRDDLDAHRHRLRGRGLQAAQPPRDAQSEADILGGKAKLFAKATNASGVSSYGCRIQRIRTPRCGRACSRACAPGSRGPRQSGFCRTPHAGDGRPLRAYTCVNAHQATRLDGVVVSV